MVHRVWCVAGLVRARHGGRAAARSGFRSKKIRRIVTGTRRRNVNIGRSSPIVTNLVIRRVYNALPRVADPGPDMPRIVAILPSRDVVRMTHSPDGQTQRPISG